ncbi:hypothetical protein K1W54_04365 [Micromonospora sp. CPCC 205371]|nr:hypothetical protein [Micromonospora sp. CPCC 205371]
MTETVISPSGVEYEIRQGRDGRWGAYDELSKQTGTPGATSTDKENLIAFLSGEPVYLHPAYR